MLYLDTKYISLISGKLQKFKKSNTTYNFRCPYCGDSQKNKNRARGYFFQKKGSYIFKCHNCGVGRTLANFLKDNDSSLFSEYLLESYKAFAVTPRKIRTANIIFFMTILFNWLIILTILTHLFHICNPRAKKKI